MKKQNILKELAIFCMATCMVSACNKVENERIGYVEKNTKATLENYVDYAYKEVPSFFDEIGIKHNNFLDSIGKSLLDTCDYYTSIGTSFGDAKLDTFDVVLDIIKKLYRNEIYGDNELDVEKEEEFESQYWNPFIDYIESEDFEFLDDHEVGRQLQEIIDTIDASAEIEDIIVQIRAIECCIIDKADDIEDTMIAFSLSILDHSLEYWHNAISDVTNPWYILAKENGNTKFTQNVIAQKGLLSKLKTFVTNAINKVKALFARKTDGNDLLQLALCDLAGGASMAVNGTELLTIGPAGPFVYGAAIVVSGAATSFGCALLNKK